MCMYMYYTCSLVSWLVTAMCCGINYEGRERRASLRGEGGKRREEREGGREGGRREGGSESERESEKGRKREREEEEDPILCSD